jgi:predicted O-methyltransferase YrrM
VNILTEYISYFFKAKGRHGTHSPFVYQLVSECLKTNMDNNFVLERKNLFNSLKNNKKTIRITDFGAGSKRLGNLRSIKSIFKTNTSKGKYGVLLYKIVKYYKLKNILELGTSLGIGSFHFSKANSYSQIITLEGCPEIHKVAFENLQKSNCLNIKCINSTFINFLKDNTEQKFDLIFIDGHHDGEALLNYLELLKQNSHNDTIFILDDIRWSDSMLNAWNQIIQSSDYNLTIDLFRMGIIIPRKQQEKEHFIIRF